MGRLDVLTVLECRMTKTRGRVVDNALRYITEIETCSPWMSYETPPSRTLMTAADGPTLEQLRVDYLG